MFDCLSGGGGGDDEQRQEHPDEGYHALARTGGHLLGEFCQVAFVDAVSAGTEVGEGPESEDGAAPRPGEDSEAAPLHELAEVVGAGDLAVEAAVGQVVACVAGFAQVAYDVVGVHVDDHSGEEDGGAGDELRREEPLWGVGVGRQISGEAEEPAALHEGVEAVEECAHEDDGQGHAAFAAQQEGEDERAVEIVDFEEAEEDEWS